MEKLAPLTDTFYENDFSSSSLLKNKGPNLTSEMLFNEFGDNYKGMIQKILQKSQIIDLDALFRILSEACELSKTVIKMEEVISFLLQSELAYMTNAFNFVL